MPKKRDPKASVLAYFAVVGIEEAKDTMALARELLRQRQPRVKRQPKPKGASRVEEVGREAAH